MQIFKARYTQYTGQQDLGTVASLCFGACSGGIGATVVYPLCVYSVGAALTGQQLGPHATPSARDAVAPAAILGHPRSDPPDDAQRGPARLLSRAEVRACPHTTSLTFCSVTLSKVGPSMAISWAVFEKACVRLDARPR